MDKMEQAGIKGLVGKVNMNRNSPDYLCEENAEQAAAIRHPQELSVKERLERVIYLAGDKNIVAKFVNGKQIV